MGAGFITPLSVNYSMMVGAVVSSGIAWPLLRNRAGDWFPAGLGLFNFQGEFAYHVSAPAPPLPRPTSPPPHPTRPHLTAFEPSFTRVPSTNVRLPTPCHCPLLLLCLLHCLADLLVVCMSVTTALFEKC